MLTITITAQKGGTGKSTTAAALAQAAVSADPKARVLVVDTDTQCNLSIMCGANPNAPGVYDVLHGTPAADVLQKTEQGLTVITASPNLATEETKTGSGGRLRAALDSLQSLFDICIIDTPPGAGELVINAVSAADAVIIPLEADNNSLQGLYQIAALAQHIQEKTGRPQFMGTILTRFDGRAKINRHMQQAITAAAAECGAPYLTAIRPGIAVREAQALQKSLYRYAGGSNPARDYMELWQQLRRKLGIKSHRKAFDNVPNAPKK